MAVYLNTFEGGTNGTAISVANSGGASGTAFAGIIANGVGVTSSPNIVFSTAAAQTGTLGCRMTLDATTSYLLMNASATMTDRVYIRFKATYPGPANASGVVNSMAVLLANAGSNRVIYVNVGNDNRPFLGITNSNTWLNGGAGQVDTRPPTGITPGAKYTFIVVVGKASAADATDGELGFRILDSSDSIVHSWTGTGNTGVADFSGARYGTATNTLGWTTFDFDDVELGDVASGWPPGSGGTTVAVTTGSYQTADFTGSTSGAGNTLSFSIAFTSGQNNSSGIKQPMSGLFLIPRGTADSVYTVTVNDGGTLTTQAVNVSAEGTGAVVDNGVIEYIWDGTSWNGGGNVITRDDLVPGTYVPGLVPDTVGTPVGWTPVRTEAGTPTTTTVGTFNIFRPTETLYEDIRFTCPVQPGPTVPAAVTFNRCHFVGGNPQVQQAEYDALSTWDNGLALQRSSLMTNYRAGHLTFIDCTFDPGWWFDQGLSTRVATIWTLGLNGGNFTVKRCEVLRCVDGIGWAQGPNGPTAYTEVFQSAIWKNFGAVNIVRPSGSVWTIPSGNYIHSDGFQVNIGNTLEIAYNLFGGQRNSWAQRQNMPYVPGGPDASSGDDAYNSCFMIQQEGNAYGADGDVHSLYIHDNWMGGGSGSVQLVDKNSNNLSGLTFTNNKILTRQTGWGDAVNSPGYYIVKSSTLAATITGNVTWDGTNAGLAGTGIAAPIQNYS
ncbi:hypothetical protein FWG95_01425 [Candidatus Saccharibacteria bacterium]|nr:hypothetical protein [Candidatus Saccharibacteria bacterium]